MATVRVDEAVAALAATQYGVISRDQALQMGMTRQVIESRLRGRWTRFYPGVYAIAGHPRTWSQGLMAATLSCHPDAAVSNHAAASFIGLNGFRDRTIEVSVAGNRSPRPFIVHRVRILERADVSVVRGIPTTTVARTLIDLAAVEPPARLAVALDDALMRGLVSVPRMLWRIEELAGRGRRGIPKIRSLVEARAGKGPVPESALETRMLDVFKQYGLPPPVLQHTVRIDGRRYRLDFAYPERKIAIETVGFAVHGARSAWEKDLERHNDLTRAGWRVVYVTSRRLDADEAAVAQDIRALLDDPVGLPRRARSSSG